MKRTFAIILTAAAAAALFGGLVYVSSAAACEARDELGAYLSLASLNGYVLERSGELLRAEMRLLRNSFEGMEVRFADASDLALPTVCWAAEETDWDRIFFSTTL